MLGLPHYRVLLLILRLRRVLMYQLIFKTSTKKRKESGDSETGKDISHFSFSDQKNESLLDLNCIASSICTLFFNILNIFPVRKRVLIVHYFYSGRPLSGILGAEWCDFQPIWLLAPSSAEVSTAPPIRGRSRRSVRSVSGPTSSGAVKAGGIMTQAMTKRAIGKARDLRRINGAMAGIELRSQRISSRWDRKSSWLSSSKCLRAD